MIPKAERDADAAILAAATGGKWHYSPTAGIHVQDGDGRVAIAFPEDVPDGREEANGTAAALAVNRLPEYIAALDEMERRIAEVETEREKLARKLASATIGSGGSHTDGFHGGIAWALRILRGGQ